MSTVQWTVDTQWTVSNPYGVDQPILLPQLAFSSLLPALQHQVEDEDNDDGQYNHLMKMVIILVKNTTYTEMVIIGDGENYHSCAEAQNVFNLKQV